MKKLISFILIVAISFAITTQAQTLQKPTDKAGYEYFYKGVSTDTVGAGTTKWNLVLKHEQTEGLYTGQQLSLSKTGGTLHLKIEFQGKYFDTDTSYATIATAYFTGTVTDTLINCVQTSISTYNYYRTLITRNNGTAKVNKYKAFLKR
jgi:hypothetical protein